MSAMNHLHTFKRKRGTSKGKNYGGTYMCVHPKCTSYYSHEVLAGKEAMCKCGEVFTIDPRFHFQRAEMKCYKCTQSSHGKKYVVAEGIAASIFGPGLSVPPQNEVEQPELPGLNDEFESEFEFEPETSKKDVA